MTAGGGWTDWRPVRVGRAYAPIPRDASGVYVIRRRRGGKVVYVGQSHTGRLRKTALRHFQHWKRDHFHQFDRATYDPATVEIRWRVVTGGRLAVLRAEAEAIAELHPSDNIEVPVSSADEPADVAPF